MREEILRFIPSDFPERVGGWGSKLAGALLIFLGFKVASVIVKKLICRLGHRTDPQREEILRLIGELVRIALLIMGIITALGTLGINVAAVVAGLGLTGFALGFAFRDALSNVLAGVMILLYHPFHRGDHVAVAGFEGEVTGIDLRFTTLQAESKTFLIPNSILLTNAISVSRA